MSSLIVVCGPPGAGKSTLSRALVVRNVIDAVRLSSDEVGLTIMNGCGVDYKIQPTSYLKAANDVMLHMWAELLEAGMHCIHDATVPGADTWKRLASLAASRHATLDVVCLDSSDELLVRRVAERTTRQLVSHDRTTILREARIARATYSWLQASGMPDSFMRIDSGALTVDDMLRCFAGR